MKTLIQLQVKAVSSIELRIAKKYNLQHKILLIVEVKGSAFHLCQSSDKQANLVVLVEKLVNEIMYLYLKAQGNN